MEWKDIAKANEEIELTQLKGKDYAEVKERVIAFRKLNPNGQIITADKSSENYIFFEAKVYDNDNHLIATGHARELANKPFALENAETSAIGRALGFCGFGIKTGIASAEDMQNIESPSGVFNGMEADAKRKEEAIAKFYKLNVKQQADILNIMHKQKVEDIELNLLEELIRNAK